MSRYLILGFSRQPGASTVQTRESSLSLSTKFSTTSRAPSPSVMATLASNLAAVTSRPSHRLVARSASARHRAVTHRPVTASSSSSSSADAADASTSTSAAEALLLSRLESVSKTRGASATPADERAIADAVTALELAGGLERPATREEITGTWRLLYTSKSDFDVRNPLGSRVDGTAPGIEGFFTSIFGDDDGRKMAEGVRGSSSPIQRTVTSLEAFTIQQAIRLGSSRTGKDDRVDQVVQFGDNGHLRLSAAASVDAANSLSRIDFTFDMAYFEIRRAARAAALRPRPTAVSGAVSNPRRRGEGLARHDVPGRERADIQGEQGHDVRAGEGGDGRHGGAAAVRVLTR